MIRNARPEPLGDSHSSASIHSLNPLVRWHFQVGYHDITLVKGTEVIPRTFQY